MSASGDRIASEYDPAGGAPAGPRAQPGVPGLGVSLRRRLLARPRFARCPIDVVLQLAERLSGDPHEAFPAVWSPTPKLRRTWVAAGGCPVAISGTGAGQLP